MVKYLTINSICIEMVTKQSLKFNELGICVYALCPGLDSHPIQYVFPSSSLGPDHN